MRVLRYRAPEEVRRDALKVAERKAAEGCGPCAEAYLAVAEQNGASPAEVDHARRRLFKRAGALAGMGLVASLLDVPGALAGSPERPQLRLSSLSTPETAHRRRLARQDTRVQQLAGFLHDHGHATNPASAQAFTGTAEGMPLAILLEDGPVGSLLVVLQIGAEQHAGAVLDDTLFVVEGGRVVASELATKRFREIRSGDRHSLAGVVSGALRPAPAEAACAICAGLAASCAFAVGLCASGACPPCCNASISICALAINCCFLQ
jgi:hypothetical protein